MWCVFGNWIGGVQFGLCLSTGYYTERKNLTTFHEEETPPDGA